MAQGGRVSCALCKSGEDKKSIITCTICKNSFHTKCVNVDPRGFHKKQNTWQCKTELCSENISSVQPISDLDGLGEGRDICWDSGDKILDSQVFRYVLRQKDDLILELRDKVKLLYDQVELLQDKLSDKDRYKKLSVEKTVDIAIAKPVCDIDETKKRKQTSVNKRKESAPISVKPTTELEGTGGNSAASHCARYQDRSHRS